MSNSKYSINRDDKLFQISVDGKYSFYKNAVAFLIGISSIQLTQDVYCREPNSELIGKYKNLQYIFFEGYKECSNRIYYIFPEEFKDLAYNNKYPKKFRLAFKIKTFEDAVKKDDGSSGVARAVSALGQYMFLHFWENLKSDYNDSYSFSKPVDLPNILKFAWMVRNAFSHNQKILINDSKVGSAHWMKLSIGFERNGQNIFHLINAIALIILMKEIEDYVLTEANKT